MYGTENVGAWVLLWQHDTVIIVTDTAWESAEGIIAFIMCLLRQTMTRLFLDAAHKHYFLWYYWPLSSVLVIWIILQNPHFIQELWVFSLVQKMQSELICWHSHITINNSALGSKMFFFWGVGVIRPSTYSRSSQGRIVVWIGNCVPARLIFWFTHNWNSGAPSLLSSPIN